MVWKDRAWRLLKGIRSATPAVLRSAVRSRLAPPQSSQNTHLAFPQAGLASSLWLLSSQIVGEKCYFESGVSGFQQTLSNNKDNAMSFNKILTVVGLFVAIVSVFQADFAAYSGLILVLLGLVSGFASPIADMTGRMAYTVAAVAMPVVANSLDAIPGVGGYLNAIIDNIAVMLAGVVVANFLLAVKDSAMPSGN